MRLHIPSPESMNSLSQETIDLISVNIFKMRSLKIGLFMDHWFA